MMHDAQMSYKQLPLRLYEMTRYSFRVEQRGELTGLRRLRAFTMPDTHAFCQNYEQAKEEMIRRFELSKDIQQKIGLNVIEDFELAIRVTKDFFEDNKEFIVKLANLFGKPALIEMWDERSFYFVMKYELNFVDALDKASALTTDQIDIENAERYDINFVDKDGKKKKPLILHCSPSGAIERVMYALLEKAYFMEKEGKNPLLPLWLAPTQVRIIPVSVEKHMDFASKLSEEIEKQNIRVDIDDDVQTVGKRIMKSEEEWVPYVLVIGDKEMESNELMVRLRETSDQKLLSKEKLVNEIKSKIESMPFKPLPLPKLLSKRPTFV